MLELLVEVDGVVEGTHLPVNAHARETLATEIVEKLHILALATANHGCEHVGAPSVAGGKNLVGNLIGRLLLDNPSALGAVRNADTGVQQAQVVVDLGYRAYRRTRVLARGLLIDRYGGRKTVDGIKVGLVHLPEKLARIARKRLNVTALALGENGIERERALARS